MRKNIVFQWLVAFLFVATSSLQSQVAPRVQVPQKRNALAKSGQFIDVNAAADPQSAYTPAQMVQNVLLSGTNPCTTPNISNVSITPVSPPSETDRPWGYFKRGTANFPFSSGIVLSTGYARKAGNQQEATNSDNLDLIYSTVPDQDLADVLGVNASQLNDVVVLEFDFVPFSNQLKFNYLFASEEYYASFPCSYSDSFALLLKKVGDPTYTNLAVLPGNGAPVSVTNVHPDTEYDGSSLYCGASNEQYFGSYNNPVTGHNFNGTVVPLTATATVIPGQTYHIKMVVADFTDNSYDSAVFLDANSFDIGIQIVGPNNQPFPSVVSACANTVLQMSSSVNIPGSVYSWTHNGVPIPGANGPTYNATAPGIYCLSVTLPGAACPIVTCITVEAIAVPQANDTTLTACYGPGSVVFNLPLAQSAINNSAGATFAYYLTQADAQAGNANTIPNPASYVSAGGVVYVRVTENGCFNVAKLTLVKAPEVKAVIGAAPALKCDVKSIQLNASGSLVPPNATITWTASNGGTITAGAGTLQPTITSAGTYTLTISNTYQPGNVVCSSSASITVTQDLPPPVPTLTSPDTKICAGESTTLVATGGQVYYWGNTSTSTGNTITVSPTVTTTYEVYSVAPNGCKSEIPAKITIEVTPDIKSGMPAVSGYICTGDTIKLDAASTGPNYTYLWNTGATTPTITVSEPGSYSVTVSNGFCSRVFTTEVKKAIAPPIIKAEYANGTLVLTVDNPSQGTVLYSVDGGQTWQTSNTFQNVPANQIIALATKIKDTSCIYRVSYYTFVMPNAITPNGDNKHDVIDLSGLRLHPNFGATIFDRYGKEIWKAGPSNYIWDGRFQGKALPTSTYWYEVHYQDEVSKTLNQLTGWIFLKNAE